MFELAELAGGAGRLTVKFPLLLHPRRLEAVLLIDDQWADPDGAYSLRVLDCVLDFLHHPRQACQVCQPKLAVLFESFRRPAAVSTLGFRCYVSCRGL